MTSKCRQSVCIKIKLTDFLIHKYLSTACTNIHYMFMLVLSQKNKESWPHLTPNVCESFLASFTDVESESVSALHRMCLHIKHGDWNFIYMRMSSVSDDRNLTPSTDIHANYTSSSSSNRYTLPMNGGDGEFFNWALFTLVYMFVCNFCTVSVSVIYSFYSLVFRSEWLRLYLLQVPTWNEWIDCRSSHHSYPLS